MGYERYSGNSNSGDYNRQDPQDYGHDHGSGRDHSYSSARDYQAAGAFDRDRSRGGYGQRGAFGEQDRNVAERGYGQQQRGYGRDRDARFGDGEYRGSYASDGRRFTETGRESGGRDHGRQQQSYGRQPQGYDYDDRGFLDRAGDEVRSWFGDEDAERRRDLDARYDQRSEGSQGGRHNAYGRDDDYHQWRRGQIDALDRDYDEYRRENRSKFETEFGSWRAERQSQRNSLSQVQEHFDVIGSDGAHIGTVDKVRGDRIILTKSDADAGGHHHSIPSRWIDSVDAKQVKVRKTAEEAKAHWRDEERNTALFGQDNGDRKDSDGPRNLNRSFSGTY